MKQVDVLVIGGGVLGSAILHKLSSYNVKTVLVEKEPDLCEGTSKANSAILHTGFDAPVNSIESDCLVRSQSLWPKIVKDHNLTCENRGAVMVAFDEEDKKTIKEKYVKNAELNGVEVRCLTRKEVLERNPAVNRDCIGGLLIENESIVDPFEATYSFAEVAVSNGMEVKLNSKVIEIFPEQERFLVVLEDGTRITTTYIVNAAGLYADKIARMINDNSFNITPRKGQFIVTKSSVDIKNIILPVPSAKSKGKLVTPAVFGGHLLGPTAEDIDDKKDKSTTKSGLQEILQGCEKLIPDVRSYTTVRQYAGIRSVSSEGDYILRPSEQNKRMIHVAGIRSTGLSASPGIAERVVEELKSVGGNFEKKRDWEPSLSTLSNKEEATEEIVCLCKLVTKKEIANVLNRSVTPETLDGIKRRTGAMLGECQGSCCIPKIMDLMKENDKIGELPLKGSQDTTLPLKSQW